MPFTTNSPVAGGSPLPDGVTAVGGIVLDMIGASGARVVSQIAASDLYVGFYSESPGLIGTQAGFTQMAIDALGGGIVEASVRFTIDDGDTAPGNFDYYDNVLLINGIAFGDFSDVETVQTDGVGNVLSEIGTGFPNARLATGFFHLTDAAALGALFESLYEGTVTFALDDRDPDDNYFDFTQGVDGGLVDVGQLPNVSPVIDRVQMPEVMVEGSAFAVTVVASDPDATAGGLTYRFDFDGDGAFEIENTTGAATFSAPDDVEGVLTVEVADTRGGLTRQSVGYTVQNVAPTVVLDPVAAIAAGGTAELSGTITDPGLADSFVIAVAWGDGTVEEFDIAANASADRKFSLTHVYESGSATGAFPVAVTVTDDDGGEGQAETAITVDGGPPSIALDPLSQVKEGGGVVLSGTVSGMSGVESYLVRIDWGDGTTGRVTLTPQDGGRFSISHVYTDDQPPEVPRDDFTITAKINTPDGRVSEVETVTVRNVAPSLALDPIQPVVVGGVLTLSGTLVDPGTADTFTMDVSWGDETDETFHFGASDEGRQTFSLDHRIHAASPTARHPLTITVRDDDGATRTYLPIASVEPDLPQVTLDDPVATTENGVVTLTGSIATEGDSGPFTVTVSWGDGTSETFIVGGSDTLVASAFATVAGGFSVTHRYLDDKPSGTDSYTITASAEGYYGTGPDAVTTVDVANVAPTLTLAPMDPIGADGMASLTGTVVDPGRNDTFTVLIDWGEAGSATRFQTVTLGASESGQQTFTRTHVYDDPAAASGFDVNVTIVDDDGGSDEAASHVEVENTAPTLSVQKVASITEGGWAVLRGTVTDPDLEGPVTLSIDWGDGRPNSIETVNTHTGPGGVRSFSIGHRYLDDPQSAPADYYEITATAVDRAGASASLVRGVHVANAAPTFSGALSSNVAASDTVAAGAPVSIGGYFRDSGILDAHSVTIDWGDGTMVSSAANPGQFSAFVDNGWGGRFMAEHRYAHGGFYDVRTIMYDDDGGRTVATRRIAVEGVDLNPRGVINVIAGDDPVVVNVFGDNTLRGRLMSEPGTASTNGAPFVAITTDIAGAGSQTAASASVNGLVFTGSNGADTIDISPTVPVGTTIRGLAGVDRLFGGTRRDFIEGNQGGDEIFGRQGRDTLVGGYGADRIYGDFDDIRFGGAADLVRGGDGQDSIAGGGGFDTLFGDNGNDRIAGGAGNDSMSGGLGADLMFGDADAFAASQVRPVAPGVNTGPRTVRQTGTQGDPLPQAQSTAMDGADWMFGGYGNDRLYGQNGNDTLRGGGGNDILDGGHGRDFIYTGAGADRIVFRAGDGADLVFDFGPADRIDLREFDRPYIDDAADVLARTTFGADAIIDLGYGDSLRLIGVGRGEISQDDFLV